MTNDRMNELLLLAEAGDHEIALLVESEIALMPETREQLLAWHDAYAEEVLESMVPPPVPVDDETLLRLAEEAEF